MVLNSFQDHTLVGINVHALVSSLCVILFAFSALLVLTLGRMLLCNFFK